MEGEHFARRKQCLGLARRLKRFANLTRGFPRASCSRDHRSTGQILIVLTVGHGVVASVNMTLMGSMRGRMVIKNEMMQEQMQRL